MVITRNCCKGSVDHPASPDRSAVYICCLFSTSSLHSVLDTRFHTKFAFSVSRTYARNENLRTYAPDSERSFTKAKLAR